MSELELSNLKYPPLEKLGNLANKVKNDDDGIQQFIKILPVYEAKVNEVMQIDREEKTVTANATPSNNRPFFTGNGKAQQAVRKMQKAAKTINNTNEGFER